MWNRCQGTGVSTEGSAWDSSLQANVGVSPRTGKQKGADGAVGEGAFTLPLGTKNSVEGNSWVEEDLAPVFCEQIHTAEM